MSAPDLLAALRTRFESTVPFGTELLAALSRVGVTLTHARSLSHDSWLLRVGLPERLQAEFGLAPELGMVVARSQVFARDLNTAQHEPFRDDAESRLDPGLLVVVDPARDLGGRLDRLPRRSEALVRVAWPPPFQIDFVTAVTAQLGRVDQFDVADPVAATQLYGRAEDVRQLRTRIDQGGAVSVLGLRKVGKTSLVKEVLRQLGEGRPVEERFAQFAWVDVQTQWQRSTDALAASLAREISDSAGVSISETGSGFGALEAALRAAPERTGLRSVLVLDEFDLLFEGGPGNEPFPELSTLFGLLRGLSQTGVPLTLVMIGRDPDLPGRPLLNGVTNPLMAWSEPRWVAPFGKDAATDLLRRLGRRMGLHFGPTSAADAYTLTGGHPFLHRQFGAAVFSCMSGPIRATERREAEGIPDAESVFLERQRVCDTRREVFELLETRYPSAFKMLTRLAVAPESERIRLWEARDRDPGAMLSRLVQFGVLKFDGPRLWLPRVWEHTGRLAAGAPGLLQAG